MSEAQTTSQQFLDSSQYLESSILQYERVYGEDFVSPGGRELARETITRLELEAGARVLDVGCGLGGSAFLMAREYGLQVDGIDLSRNMLALAQRKLDAYGLSDRVHLREGDCLELDCRDHYDAVYSRDVFLHIADKSSLFERLHAALRSGGRLLFTDYCCGPKPWSDDFTGYVRERGYSLHTTEEYSALVAGAGFEQVVTEDMTTRFRAILQVELERIETLPIDDVAREKLRLAWQHKLRRAEAQEQRWALISAFKPA